MLQKKRSGSPEINTVCRNLCRGWARGSRLQQVDCSRPNDPPTFIETYQNNILFGALFRELPVPMHIPDKETFKEMLEVFKKSFPSKSPVFMKAAIAVPLGPQEVSNYISKFVNFGKNRQHKLLTYHGLQSYVLFVEPRGDLSTAMEAINKTLGRDWTTDDSEEVVVSVPNAEFATKLRTGKGPEIVRMAWETKSLLVFEDDFLFDEPEKYYSNLLNCKIESTKLLSSAEKLWIEKMLNRSNLDGRNIRKLEFACLEDRNRAAQDRKIAPFEFLFTHTMVDPNEITEQAYLEIDYDVRTPLNRTKGIKITFADEKVMARAWKVLSMNGLGVKEEEFALEKRRMLRVVEFRHDMWALIDRIWLLERIFRYNRIQFESMVPMQDFEGTSLKDYGRLIREGLRKLAGFGELRQSEVSEVQEDSWIFMKRPDSLKYRVHFKDSTFGLKILEAMVSEQLGRDQLWTASGVDPELTPILRKTFRIARRIRAVCYKTIKELDSLFRREFVDLSEAEDKIMKSEDAYHYWTRIYEDWEDGEDVGTIGVEGWRPEFVQKSLEALRKGLEPTTIEASRSPELFYGVGEAFVKTLEVKYENEVVIDIDKFNEVIRIYGSKTGQAYSDCMKYDTIKKMTTVEGDIPVDRPFFNCEEILDEVWIMEVGIALGAKIKLNVEKKTLQFCGTIEAYNLLKEGLEEVSTQFFEKQNQKDLPLNCRKCFEKTPDFFVLSCGHSFCRVCINGHVDLRLGKQEFAIRCPVGTCSGFVKSFEILTLIRGGSQRIPELDGMKLQKLASSAHSAIENLTKESDEPSQKSDEFEILNAPDKDSPRSFDSDENEW